MEKYWTHKELLTNLNIKKSSLKFFMDEGAPPKEKKGYPVRKFCEFIVGRPQKVKDKTNIRENAQKYLLEFVNDKKGKGKPVAELKKVPAKKSDKTKSGKKVTKPKKLPKTKVNSEVGMFAALERAKAAEVAAHTIYIDTLNKTGVISTNSLDAWQKTLDILRKCETDFVKVLERQKVLVQKTEVQEFLEPMIEMTKMMLLNLPSKIAPSLEDLAWHEIQERLDIEVRDILDKLTNYE